LVNPVPDFYYHYGGVGGEGIGNVDYVSEPSVASVASDDGSGGGVWVHGDHKTPWSAPTSDDYFGNRDELEQLKLL
jgi:hypothetical protein